MSKGGKGSKGGGKPPSRMTRKQPSGSQPGRRPWDPKEAYTTEQLAEVGAVILLWNQVEGFLDLLIYVALNPPIFDVSRHMSLPKRIKLLRLAAKRNEILSDDAKKMIKNTLDAVAQYEKYRNNIVHSMPYDIDKGIAHNFTYDTDMAQTIVTLPALSGLYIRLKMLIYELREVLALFLFGHPDEQKRPFRLFTREPARQEDVQERARGALLLQKERLSLPPLPEFPDEAEGHPL
jgi:hypothetical protein